MREIRRSYAPPSYRDVTSAAKALLAADRLDVIKQQAEAANGASTDSTDRSLEEPKRIVIPDVNARLAPRED